jgi:hypothetical protein
MCRSSKEPHMQPLCTTHDHTPSPQCNTEHAAACVKLFSPKDKFFLRK